MWLENNQFWMGTQGSFTQVFKAENTLQHGLETGSFTFEEPDESKGSRLLEMISDEVGLISVHGPLVSKDSMFNSMFGMTSYNEVRNAVLEAIQDHGATNLMLDFDTNGGSAKGADNLASFLRGMRSQVGMTGYSSGSVFSAGYYQASQMEAIFGSKASEFGSIGTMAVHTEFTKAMEQEGETPTVFRVGKYKAIGTPYEVLTDFDRDHIQQNLEETNEYFLEAVAEGRGMPVETVRRELAEGRTFFAKKAVNIGMIDGIKSFDEVAGTLVLKSASNQQESTGQRVFMSEGGGTDMSKRRIIVGERAQALAASGVQLEDQDLTSEEEAPDEVEEGAEPELSEGGTIEETTSEGNEDAPVEVVAAAEAGNPLQDTLMKVVGELSTTKAELSTVKA